MSTLFDPDDTFLTERMDRTFRGLQVDPDALAAGAIGRGRPIRRRRQALMAVAGVAMFGLLGGVAYAWNGPIAVPEQPRVVQPADVPSVTPTTTPTAAGSAAPLSDSLSARVIALRLERGLGLDLTRFGGQGSTEDGLYVGATGAEDKRIGVSLNVQPDFDDRSIYTCGSGDDCTVTKGKDGSVRLLQTIPDGDYRSIVADRLDADGLRTVLVVAQPTDGAEGGVSAERVAKAAERVANSHSLAPPAAEVEEAEKKVVPWNYSSDEPEPDPTATEGSVDHQVTARLAALYLSRLAPGMMAEYRGYGDGDTAGAVVMIDRDQPDLPGKAALRVVVDADAPLPGCDDPALNSCATSTPRAGVEMRQAVRTNVTMGEETEVVTVDVRTADGALVTVTGGDSAAFQGGHRRAGTSLGEVTEIALDPVWDVEAEPEPADVDAADRLEPWFWMSDPDDI